MLFPPFPFEERRQWSVTSSFDARAGLVAETGGNLGNNTNRGARVRGDLPQFGERSGAKHTWRSIW